MTLCISAGEPDLLYIKPRIFHLVQAKKAVTLEVTSKGCPGRLASPSPHPHNPPPFPDSRGPQPLRAALAQGVRGPAESVSWGTR